MGTYITGIPTARISNSFNQQQLVSQVDADQVAMNQLQLEISSGVQFQLPSQNAGAAEQVISIQSLLQQKVQFKANIATNQSYLGESDSALSSVSALLTSIQAAAVGVVGTTASDSQRTAVVQQINQAIQQLVSDGNTQFNGRYLFGGSDTANAPFSLDANGNVVYSGDNSQTSSYLDLNSLLSTNVTGVQAFGAISQPIQGASLPAALSYDTPLSALNQGAGVSLGKISISDGTSTSIVDLSSAHTIGDVATLIHDNPPAGDTIDAEVTSTGLTLQLEPNAGGGQVNLVVKEYGGTTASDLGILNPAGVGGGQLVGNPLEPAITSTTPLNNLLATTASGFINFPGPNNDIVLTANNSGATTGNGTLLNGVQIQFVGDAPAAGQETATFSSGTPATGGSAGTPGTLTVHIAVGSSRAEQIVNAINSAAGSPFTAHADPTDSNGGGQDPVTTLPTVTATSGGGGTPLDQSSGLQISSGTKTYNVDISAAKNVQDLINDINTSGAGVVAEINSARNGINVSSRVSGVDFSIGENGGTTATQLGLRTLTGSTAVTDLNHGQGVGINTTSPTGGPPSADFTISQTNPPAQAGQSPQTISFDVSVAGATTISQVIQNINTAAQAAGSSIQAQLATNGNGIELVDGNATDGAFTITANASSTAAVDLGLISTGQTSSTSSQSAGGLPQTLVGTDVNPHQTNSIFTALQQLATALTNNDNAGEQRAMSLLTNSTQNLNNTRSELGAREQTFIAINTQIGAEQNGLQSTMSTLYDTDMTQAISNFTAQQTSFQAALQTSAALLQTTLLNYL